MRKVILNALIGTVSSLALLITPVTAIAATGSGTASIHVSPASGSYTSDSTFTITITETSSTQVAAVEADMSYPASQLQCQGIDASASAFGATYQNTCTGGTITIARGVQGTPVSGAKTVASVTFKVLSSSGTAAITMVDSSEVDDTSVNNVCDSSCAGGSVAASFTLTAPAPQPTPTSLPSKTTDNSNHQPAASSTMPAQPPATPASGGKTLADTNSKATLITDTNKSAAKLPNTGRANVATTIVLFAALVALAVALASWLKNHSIRISVTARTNSSKYPAQKPARKSAKKSKQ